MRDLIVIVLTAVLVSCSPASDQRWEAGPAPREGACFYRDAYYGGPFLCAEAGESVDMLPSSVNDRVSSIRVYGGAKLTVYEDSHFRGDSIRFDFHIANLDREEFNDAISSVQIELSDDSRERRRAVSAPESVVRRAYQDILGRDPDPDGMRIYSNHIDSGWTEQQVRIDVRRSQEYREKYTITPTKAEEIVRRAYLSVLAREPDEGSRGYVSRVLRDGWTLPDVEHELQQSPEYHARIP